MKLLMLVIMKGVEKVTNENEVQVEIPMEDMVDATYEEKEGEKNEPTFEEPVLNSIEEDVLNEEAKTMQTILTHQQQLNKDFNAKLKYDQHKDQLINKLHKELQQYKDDVVKTTIKPIIYDLLMLNDTIDKLVENFKASEEPLQAEEILSHLENVTMDIDDVLYRQGIEPYNCPEQSVSLNRQKILNVVKTGDSSKEQQIAERVKKGYEWDDMIIRKEVVSVYVYDENLEKTDEGEDDNDERS